VVDVLLVVAVMQLPISSLRPRPDGPGTRAGSPL
jgi:hypothetical protein